MLRENDIVLLCFPPKMTHLLQPCDVVVYKRLKSEIVRIMQTLKMTRGDLWISKTMVPAILKTVCERTFKHQLIMEAFRKCGIYPLDREVILKEVQPKDDVMKSLAEQDLNPDITILSDITLDVVNSPPANAEILEANTNESGQTCPPALALLAIENNLPCMKKATYEERFAAGITKSRDGLYTAWANLKSQCLNVNAVIGSGGQERNNQNRSEQRNLLVDAGLIPPDLDNIFKAHSRKLQRKRQCVTKARVLTSKELSAEIKKKTRKKKEITKKKEAKKLAKEGKFAKKKPIITKTIKRSAIQKKDGRDIQHGCRYISGNGIPSERQRYFFHLQAMLASCKDADAVRKVIPSDMHRFALDFQTPETGSDYKVDAMSLKILSSYKEPDLLPISIYGDGNCLPRSISAALTNDETFLHVEIRVRIAIEMMQNMEYYLNDATMASPDSRPGVVQRYATYSQFYQPEHALIMAEIRLIFEKEAMEIVGNGIYCGIWQIHAAASVMGRSIRSIYPGRGPPKRDLDRKTIQAGLPSKNDDNPPVIIMWTSTINDDVSSWWQPNHFVLVKDLQTKTPPWSSLHE